MTITVGRTSYGRAALDALRETVARLKTHDAMSPVIIIVPNNIAGIVARRALAQGVGGRRGVAGLDVTTLSMLAERLAAPGLTPRSPATRSVLAAAWRRELALDPLGFGSLPITRRRSGPSPQRIEHSGTSAPRGWTPLPPPPA